MTKQTGYLKSVVDSGAQQVRPKKSFHSKDLPHIHPKNNNQRIALEEFMSGQNVNLFGSAGTGKTFLAIWLGLHEVLRKDTDIDTLIIVRSAVPVRDIGFLPGSAEEKTEIYELPYKAICDELFEYSNSYDTLKDSEKVKFVTTSYVRGLTFNNAVVVVDECQSLNAHELDSIITRLGSNSRIIMCGDGDQTDLVKAKDRDGFKQFVKILADLPMFHTVAFTEDDIVRSKLVREYIIKRNRLGLDI
jgi:predicted ribonuclease YlaK